MQVSFTDNLGKGIVLFQLDHRALNSKMRDIKEQLEQIHYNDVNETTRHYITIIFDVVLKLTPNDTQHLQLTILLNYES